MSRFQEYEDEISRQREHSAVDGDLYRKIDRIRVEERGELGSVAPADIPAAIDRLIERLLRELSPTELGLILRDWLVEHPHP